MVGTVLASTSEIVHAIQSHRYNMSSEDDLQRGIAMALTNYEIPHEREVRLGIRDRIDFKIGGIGLEVKIGGSTSDVTRQLGRYAASPRIDALILVTTRMRISVQMPTKIGGKVLTVIHIMGGVT